MKTLLCPLKINISRKHKFKKFNFVKMKIFIILFFVIYATVFVNICFSQWQQVFSSGTIYSLSNSAGYYYAATMGAGVIRSTNNGVSWVTTSLNYTNINGVYANNNYVFAAGMNGFYTSTNNGVNWGSPLPLGNTGIASVTMSGTNVLAGNFNYGIYISNNNGANFIQTNLTSGTIESMASNGAIAYAAKTSGGIYTSNNYGATWAQSSLATYTFKAFAINGSVVYAGAYYYGVFKSDNSGASWYQTSLFQNVYSLVVNGNYVAAGTDTGVYLSSNSGLNWSKQNTGFSNPTPRVNSLMIANNYLYAGTDTKGIWRRPLTDLVWVEQNTSEKPDFYSLEQNYPNPFNQSTMFNVQCPIGGDVSVKVFDVTGKEITTLVNEYFQPGTYQVRFDAAGLTSGIYFYTFEANGFRTTRKCILLK